MIVWLIMINGLLTSSVILTKGQRYDDDDVAVLLHPVGPKALGIPDAISQPQAFTPLQQSQSWFFNDKRGNMEEPSCDELRAMWRYSKRQSRAAEITNEIPTYRDPFSYNVWEPYLDRAQSSHVYREPTGPARVRGAGGVPIYGRIIHKAPAGHRLRNGMPDRTREAFKEVTRHYGTVNRHPAQSPRRRPTSFRNVGGASPSSSSQDSSSSVPQAGSFQHLKELIRTERARELQEQRIAEEVAARTAALKEMTNGRRQAEPETRQHYLNSLQPYNDMKNVNYNDYDQVQYVGNLGQSLSRGDQYGRGYALR